MAKKTTSKRERIDTGSDKRFMRRDERGHFKESDASDRSLSQDRKQPAETKVKSGHGDRGDR